MEITSDGEKGREREKLMQKRGSKRENRRKERERRRCQREGQRGRTVEKRERDKERESESEREREREGEKEREIRNRGSKRENGGRDRKVGYIFPTKESRMTSYLPRRNIFLSLSFISCVRIVEPICSLTSF